MCHHVCISLYVCKCLFSDVVLFNIKKQAFNFYRENPQIPKWIDNCKQDKTDVYVSLSLCVCVCVCVCHGAVVEHVL